MSVRVASNRFGRTGRAAFRAAREHGAEIERVAPSATGPASPLAQALRVVPGARPRRSGEQSRSTTTGWWRRLTTAFAR